MLCEFDHKCLLDQHTVIDSDCLKFKSDLSHARMAIDAIPFENDRGGAAAGFHASRRTQPWRTQPVVMPDSRLWHAKAESHLNSSSESSTRTGAAAILRLGVQFIAPSPSELIPAYCVLTGVELVESATSALPGKGSCTVTEPFTEMHFAADSMPGMIAG